MTKHEKFLQELRAPFLKMVKPYSAGGAGNKPDSRPAGGSRKRKKPRWDPDDAVLAELETRFNSIFVVPDEDDD